MFDDNSRVVPLPLACGAAYAKQPIHMSPKSLFLSALLVLSLPLDPLAHGAAYPEPVILVEPGAGPMINDAARDLRIYWQRMTGRLMPRVVASEQTRIEDLPDGSFVLGRLDRHPVLKSLPPTDLDVASADLGEEGYTLKTVARPSGRVTVVAANSERGVMYGAYGLLEHVGVRFFLEHDTVPDLTQDAPVLSLDRVERPSLSKRGALPWSNFLASPLVWDRGDYYRYIDQLAKQKYNLLLFHVYSKEPYLRFEYDGQEHDVLHGDHFKWSWEDKKTPPMSELPYGVGLFFNGPAFGSQSWLQADTSTESFENVSSLLGDAFRYAKRRGMKIGLGLEVGSLPDDVLERLPPSAYFAGTDIIDPLSETVREILELRIRNLIETYPEVDYVTFWQPEAIFLLDVPLGKSSRFDEFYEEHRKKFMQAPPRPGKPEKQRLFDRRVRTAVWTAAYFKTAVEVLAEVAPDKTPVIAGWGGSFTARGQLLGSIEGLDLVLPKNVVFTYLTSFFGNARVSPLFGNVKGREKWPLSWFESDNALWLPQPNVHRTERQLESAKKHGATGWAGIHWRTKATEKAVSYASRRLWTEDLSPEAFYLDYAERDLGAGPEVANALGRFDDDARFIASPEWLGYRRRAPTGVVSEKRRAALAGASAALERHRASGEQRERLNDLRDEFEGERAVDQIGQAVESTLPILAELEKSEDPPTPEQEERLAAAIANLRDVPMESLFRSAADRVRVKEHLGLLMSLSASGHASWRKLVLEAEAKLSDAEPEPVSAGTRTTAFEPHTFLWSRSPVYEVGKPAPIEAIVATQQSVKAVLRYRELGTEDYSEVPMEKVAAASYRAPLPASALQGSIVEYFIDVRDATTGEAIPSLRHPTTAPERPLWMSPLD